MLAVWSDAKSTCHHGLLLKVLFWNNFLFLFKVIPLILIVPNDRKQWIFSLIHTFLLMSTEWWTSDRRRQCQRGFCLLLLHRRHHQRWPIQFQPGGQPGPELQLEPRGGHPVHIYCHRRPRRWWWRRRCRRRRGRGKRQSERGAAAFLSLTQQHSLPVASSASQLGSRQEQRRRGRDEPEEVRVWRELHEPLKIGRLSQVWIELIWVWNWNTSCSC